MATDPQGRGRRPDGTDQPIPPDAQSREKYPRGSRTPAFRCLPAVSSGSAGPEVVELAEAAGLVLDPWQADFLNDALLRSGEGWAATKVGLIVPRQNGKGAVLEARIAAGLFLFGERLQVYTAHEIKTSQELFRRLVGLVEEHFEDRVKAIRWTNGQESIETVDGCRVRFIARSRKSGRGFSADAIYFDEAFELGSEDVASAVPAMSAGKSPQLWFVSSAPHAHSEVLRGVQSAGREGSDDTLAYAEWCAPDDSDLDDPEAIAKANPALGIRLTVEFTREERAILDELSYLRERLGISRFDATDLVIPLDVWEAAEDATSKPVDDIQLAVDVSPNGADASVAVAGRRSDNRYHVELVDARPKTSWVAARVADLFSTHADLKRVLVDARGPAAALIPELTNAGVPEDALVLVGAADMAAACGLFVAAVEEDGLRYMPHPMLTDALKAASTRPLVDSWAWSRRRSAGTITPLVAATLATWAAAGHRKEEEPPMPFFAWT